MVTLAKIEETVSHLAGSATATVFKPVSIETIAGTAAQWQTRSFQQQTSSTRLRITMLSLLLPYREHVEEESSWSDLSIQPFARDWDSEADQIYDAL